MALALHLNLDIHRILSRFGCRCCSGCGSFPLTALPSSLWRILDLWVCMALEETRTVSKRGLSVSIGREIKAYLVRMSEPSGPLLLIAHKRHPVIAAMAQALPDIHIALHPPD